MSLKILLLTPRRQFLANKAALGYQMPLGLVFLGGPLLDAGHQLSLLDNDLEGLDDEALAARLREFAPQLVLLGHTASYAAHPAAMRCARLIRETLPEVCIAYGGVYPTYAAETVLQEHPAVDLVARGEGEELVVELAAALEESLRTKSPLAPLLARVRGLSYREQPGGASLRRTPDRALIQNLDAFRPAWELVDFKRYPLFKLGPTAGFQFSRGCPHHCTFCGQFQFWKRWRHRSPENVVSELSKLVFQYGVKSVWLADESFGADKEAARALLQALVDAKLGLTLNINLTAADVVNQAELLPLYRAAGVEHVALGVETLDDQTVEAIQKNNPFAISLKAMALLREQGIMSLVNVIYGLQDERPATLWKTFVRLLQMDPDVLNAVFLTPLFWSRDGARSGPAELAKLVSEDQSRYSYRDPVLKPKHMGVRMLFLSVKLSEALFHLRPKALWRMLFAKDRRHRDMIRGYFKSGLGVWLSEIWDFVWLRRDLVPAGSVHRLPGAPRRQDAPALARKLKQQLLMEPRIKLDSLAIQLGEVSSPEAP